jgi:hypothetical protein
MRHYTDCVPTKEPNVNNDKKWTKQKVKHKAVRFKVIRAVKIRTVFFWDVNAKQL